MTDTVGQNLKKGSFNILHFEWTKINKKWSILASFLNIEACGQTVLPDRSIFIEQKLVENAKIEKRHFNV